MRFFSACGVPGTDFRRLKKEAAHPFSDKAASSHMLRTAAFESAAFYMHVVNLKELIRVLQLKLPVVLMYSSVKKKVQSSDGSMDIVL